MPNQTSALDFFAETLSAAEGKFTPEKFKHALDDIFAAAQRDPQAEIVLVFRKGEQVALLAMAQGKMVSSPAGIAEILRPVVGRI